MDVNQFWWEKNKKYIAGVVTAAAVFLFMKYVLTLVLPFFLSVCLISVMQPLLQKLEDKLHINKNILAAITALLALCLLGALLWYTMTMICSQISMLARNIDVYEDCFCRFIHSCCRGMERSMGIDADAMETMIFNHVDSFTADMKRKAFPRLMNYSVSYVKEVCSITAFLVMTFIATVLFVKDFRGIREELCRFRWFLAAEEISREIGTMVWQYLKAQAIILCVISVLCASGLWVLGIRHGVTTGILAGILDALPFIGTGIVLVPVALWQLIQGKVWKCAGILLLYGICALAREFLEPKLIGRKMGIYPVVILLAIYSGIKLYGLSGVALGPFSFLVIREIYRKVGASSEEGAGVETNVFCEND